MDVEIGEEQARLCVAPNNADEEDVEAMTVAYETVDDEGDDLYVAPEDEDEENDYLLSASSDDVLLREEILELMREVLPDEADDADDLLAQFDGREAALRDALLGMRDRSSSSAEDDDDDDESSDFDSADNEEGSERDADNAASDHDWESMTEDQLRRNAQNLVWRASEREKEPVFADRDSVARDLVGSEARNGDDKPPANDEGGAEESSTMKVMPPAKHHRAPSPPRWRFVKEAKSTLGYSSNAAGAVVVGKEASELGAEYVAPEIARRVFEREEIETGRLDATDLRFKTFEKEGREVGRLDINEGGDGVEELYEGGIVVSHDPTDPSERNRPSRVWANYQPRSKDVNSDHDQDKDRYTNLIETEEDTLRKHQEVGRLAFHPDGGPEEPIEGAFPGRKLDDEASGEGITGPRPLKSPPTVTFSSATKTKEPTEEDDENPSSSEIWGNFGLTHDDDDDDDYVSKAGISEHSATTGASSHSRNKWARLAFLLLPLLLAGAITGVILGGREENDPEDGGPRAFGAAILPPANVSNGTVQPSTSPSSPGKSNLFLFGGTVFDNEEDETAVPSNAPSADSPSAKPSPSPTDSPSVGPTEPPMNPPSTRPSRSPTFFPSSGPTATPTNSPSSGPSRSPTDSPSDGPTEPPTNPPSKKPSRMPTGPPSDVPTPTPSNPPSSKPSRSPTISPSSTPTNPPSRSPTDSPSGGPTESPTRSPSIFLGVCPRPFDPQIYNPIGTLVVGESSSDGIVYECIDYSCGSYGFEPGTGVSWEEGWEVAGRCEGTPSPSSGPSRGPSATPTAGPSRGPSRSPTDGPSKSPSEEPTKSPFKAPSKQPTPGPSATPSEVPTPAPSEAPSRSPTAGPSISPSRGPTPVPSQAPSGRPTSSPSGAPSSGPTRITISDMATLEPSAGPTARPSTGSPSDRPTEGSTTLEPSVSPSTARPTSDPSESPTEEPTFEPSNAPSVRPTRSSSSRPSSEPTLEHSETPSTSLTRNPSEWPSSEPSLESSDTPSLRPTGSPSVQPTEEPTSVPSGTPFATPTGSPSDQPTDGPTLEPSDSPSTGPTRSPSGRPTDVPTIEPSAAPSAGPTRSPSDQPTDGPTLEPSAAPSAGPTRSPSDQPTDGPTLEPSAAPSAGPTRSPSDQPTYGPTRSPSDQPTEEPTASPSASPTLGPSQTEPTETPTQSPTPRPTCEENGNFNLCIAIDMSGSVCNGRSSGLCESCQPLNECNSGGEKPSTCCPNFQNMLGFTKDLIAALGELPTDQDFSIVHFATDVSVESTLNSWRQAIKSVNRLKYTGGKTNLAGAIDSCQSTLDQSPPDRKNLMLIITDGEPSVPRSTFAAKRAATEAASNARDEDTFIIPVLIEEQNENNPAVSYLRNDISSDGSVFVSDFEGLNSLQDSLFEQVTCQARSNSNLFAS